MNATHLLESLARLLEYSGAAVILIGVVYSSLRYLADNVRSSSRKAAYRRYRARLGRGILLGLEILVAADIIATVTAPLTLESVSVLALIVLIRTFLSISLETEIEGRWPWDRSVKKRPEQGNRGAFAGPL